MSCKRLDISPTIRRVSCRISDETFETYGMMSAEQSAEQSAEDERQWNIEPDLTQEQYLAERFLESLDSCPDWPDYADPLPYEVQEPQIFGP